VLFKTFKIGWAQGFGSETHVLGLGLAIALNLNRGF
jgi:hypothetical protein